MVIWALSAIIAGGLVSFAGPEYLRIEDGVVWLWLPMTTGNYIYIYIFIYIYILYILYIYACNHKGRVSPSEQYNLFVETSCTSAHDARLRITDTNEPKIAQQAKQGA